MLVIESHDVSTEARYKDTYLVNRLSVCMGKLIEYFNKRNADL